MRPTTLPEEAVCRQAPAHTLTVAASGSGESSGEDAVVAMEALETWAGGRPTGSKT